MRKEFPRYAYLEFDELHKCMFPSENALVFKDYNGEIVEGFFDNRFTYNNRFLVTVVAERWIS